MLGVLRNYRRAIFLGTNGFWDYTSVVMNSPYGSFNSSVTEESSRQECSTRVSHKQAYLVQYPGPHANHKADKPCPMQTMRHTSHVYIGGCSSFEYSIGGSRHVGDMQKITPSHAWLCSTHTFASMRLGFRTNEDIRNSWSSSRKLLLDGSPRFLLNQSRSSEHGEALKNPSSFRTGNGLCSVNKLGMQEKCTTLCFHAIWALNIS
ncbi:hypothetical protein VNO77_27680 [Canavalia gladiata]|uniref:Uncharacterized protein n=1 Tax=Canavalia gladiata TaxID=3824 RepID=A0AAN9KXC9_CANGL